MSTAAQRLATDTTLVTVATAINNLNTALSPIASVASSQSAGLMSASDKSKLDGLEVATLAEAKTYLGIS